jgi:hypothetical protein
MNAALYARISRQEIWWASATNVEVESLANRVSSGSAFAPTKMSEVAGSLVTAQPL